MALGSLLGAGIGAVASSNPWTGAAIGLGLGNSVFGSGESVKVPGSMSRPTNPANHILDKNSYVKDPFKLEGYQSAHQDTATGLLGDLKGMATSKGPTQYGQALLDANNAEANIQRDQLANQQASQEATALSNMAMKGGRGTGSIERLNNSMAVNNLNQNQAINSQSSLNRLNTLAQDEERKFGLLQGLPDQYMNMAKFDIGKKQFDIGNSLNTANNNYRAEMNAYAANQLARQQAQSYNNSNKGLLGLF